MKQKEYSEMNILFAFGKYLKQKKKYSKNKMTKFNTKMRQICTVPLVSKEGRKHDIYNNI